MIVRALRELVEYRELLWHIIIRDVKIRYKQALLGFLWTLFTPLAMMLIFTFIFSRVVHIDTHNIPYPLFVLCGILPWTFFSTSLSLCTTSLVMNYTLVTEIYFPRQILPIATICAKCIDFCISAIFLGALMFFYRVPFSLVILFVPVILIMQVVFTTGLGLILAMANLFFRDVKYFFDFFIMLWFFATPVAYSLPPADSSLQWVFIVNPMASLIGMYRLVILYGVMPELSGLVVTGMVSLIVFVVGSLLFKRFERLFPEYI